MTSGRMWILAAVLSLAPALGFTSALEAGQAKRAPKVVQIAIDKAAFGDPPAGLVIGDTVEWINLDIFDHTSTSKTGGWDVVVPAGKKVRVVMKTAGVFDYICKYHPNMTGVVRVARKK